MKTRPLRKFGWLNSLSNTLTITIITITTVTIGNMGRRSLLPPGIATATGVITITTTIITITIMGIIGHIGTTDGGYRQG